MIGMPVFLAAASMIAFFRFSGGVGFLLSKIPDGQADTLLFLEIGIHNLNLFQALFLGLKVA
jgi:hypothetical protein